MENTKKIFNIDKKLDENDFEPTSINFRKEYITNQDRTMGGNLVVDVIAVKDTVNVVWDYLTDACFKTLFGIIEQRRTKFEFFDIEYLQPNTNELKKIKAYAESISYYPFYTSGNELVWRDVNISFTEA